MSRKVEVTWDILVHVVTFTVKHVKHGAKMLLELSIFDVTLEVIVLHGKIAIGF